MHLFSWQSIDQACKANIYDLITVDSTILTHYLFLEAQWCHIMFLLIQAAQDTEWLGLIVGGGFRIKAAWVSPADSGNLS